MKLTRRQLRKLIKEHMTKPSVSDDITPEELDKIHRMIDSGDPDYTSQADALIDTFGYEPGYGGRYSTDREMYENDPYRQMVKLGRQWEQAWDHGPPEDSRFARHAEREAFRVADKFGEKGFDRKKLLDVFFDTAGEPLYGEARMRHLGIS